jgi:hypothetical protein
MFFFLLFVKNHNALKDNIQKMNELNERLDRLNKVNNYVVLEEVNCPSKMPVKKELDSPN